MTLLDDRYFKILVQEMTLKLDQGFTNALLALFSGEKETEEAIQFQFTEVDLKSIDSMLIDFAMQSGSDEQKHFFDSLHVSPLKVRQSTRLTALGTTVYKSRCSRYDSLYIRYVSRRLLT